MKVAVIRNISHYSEQFDSEIEELTTAAAYIIDFTFKIDLEEPHPRKYLPDIKLEELQLELQQRDLKKLLVGDQLSPNQTFHLEDKLDIEVIDKPMLVLEIFENKANSKDIQLQVQLAQLKYSVPRMVQRLGEAVRSERAGFGGTGEQVTEILISDMRRRIRNLERRIDDYAKGQESKDDTIPVLPIVGFYSAGKSTLFNILTSSDREIGAEAFTTMFLKSTHSGIFGYPLHFIDTVGLVDLPADILTAFDLMLSTIFAFNGMVFCSDVSLPYDQWQAQIDEYGNYLKKFIEGRVPNVIVCLTKCDLVDDDTIRRKQGYLHQQEWLGNYEIILSRADQSDSLISDVRTSFERLFKQDLTEFFFKELSPSAASKLHEIARIDNQEWHNNGTTSLIGIAPKLLLDQIRGDLYP